MKVLKMYSKVIKKQLYLILMYIFIFTVFLVLFSLSSSNTLPDFEEKKINIAIINHDESSELINGLENFLGAKTNFVTLQDDKFKIEEALLLRLVDCVIEIPNGFEKDYLSGTNPQINKIEAPDTINQVYTDNLIEQYLNSWNIYYKTTSLPNDEISSKVKEDLLKSTKVELLNESSFENNFDTMRYFFNFASYSILSIFISVIGLITILVNQENIKYRILSSPLKLKSFNLQIYLGHVLFSILVVILFILIEFIMFTNEFLTINSFLIILNLAINIFVATSISFLVGTAIKNRHSLPFISTTITLGLCFISGGFVDQSLLSDSILTIASFNPVYWYVKANNLIMSTNYFTADNLQPIISAMIIQLFFMIAIISVSLVISKYKSVKN